MKRLQASCNKSERILVGLMSGTSHDGIDAALVKITGSGPGSKIKLLYHRNFSYSAAFRSRIASAFNGSAPDICRINFDLGELFAKAAEDCIASSGVKKELIDAIASHGQTIYHIPPASNKKGSTLQIGESSVIARRTGIPVISDFRTSDVAAGGHGAPLVPYADYIMFHKKDRIRVVQNIGGIANVSVLPNDIDDVIAFDTGPGNCLINDAMELYFRKAFDKDGSIARSGTPDKNILKGLLEFPYFSKNPPKSTGKELFGREFLNRIISKKRMRPEDLLATLTHFTAHSIKNAYNRFILAKYEVHEIIVSGGGAKNTYLMDLLKDLFSPLEIRPSDLYAIPSMSKEAVSFAILANETLSGNPSNLPRVTGASEKVILGKITLP